MSDFKNTFSNSRLTKTNQSASVIQEISAKWILSSDYTNDYDLANRIYKSSNVKTIYAVQLLEGSVSSGNW